MLCKFKVFGELFSVLSLVSLLGCTVKAVGDPNRPITIQAHITVDIKGLQDTASNIEDYVSGKSSSEQTKQGGTL